MSGNLYVAQVAAARCGEEVQGGTRSLGSSSVSLVFPLCLLVTQLICVRKDNEGLRR